MYGLGAAIAWSGLPVIQKGGILPGGRVATGGAFDANAIRILGLSPAYRPPVLKSPTTPSVTCWNGIKYYGAGATCPPKPLPPSSTPSAPPSGTSPINPPVVVDTGAAAGGGSTYAPIPVGPPPISQSASPSGGGTQTTDGVETDMELQTAGMFGGSLMPLMIGGAVLYALSKMKGR
jgi:hypothetical protein